MINPSGLCQCGCGAKTSVARSDDPRHGVVKGQPVRFARNHHTRIRVGDEYEVNERGCWIWKHAVDTHGYPQRNINGRTQLVHRWMYIQKHGPLSRSTKVDHLCRTPRCINPDHGEAVSNAVNVRRGNSAKLTMEQALEIRRLYASGELTQQRIADKFGVRQSIVSKVVLNQLWNEAA